MYLSADMDAIILLEGKLAIQNMLKTSTRGAREQLCQTCINILAHYRKVVSINSASAQFVLPESMKVYPLLVLSLMKSPAFRYLDEVKIDYKVANYCQLLSCSVAHFLTNIYTRVYNLSQIIQPDQVAGSYITYQNEQGEEAVSPYIHKPFNIPASTEKMAHTDLYIITNSDYIYIYVPKAVPEETLAKVPFSFNVRRFLESHPLKNLK